MQGLISTFYSKFLFYIKKMNTSILFRSKKDKIIFL